MTDAAARSRPVTAGRSRGERRRLTGFGLTSPSVGFTRAVSPRDVGGVLREAGSRGVIARGLGRSYGDAAQNAGGLVLLPGPSRITLSPESATARVSAGTSLHDLMRVVVPRGFFPLVTPGTRYVTVGGAIASDVHGKNHHHAGSFGNHVRQLTVVTADGQERTVTPEVDAGLFWATVGGMGLTGIVTEAVIALQRIETGSILSDTDRCDDLDELMAAMVAGDESAPYSVAWLDPMAKSRHLGRGVLSRGRHAPLSALPERLLESRWRVPEPPRVVAPSASLVPPRVISRTTVRAFNEAYFRSAPRRSRGEVTSLSSFFHPLDAVDGWNRLYGREGLVQYQLAVPDAAADVVRRVVERLSDHRAPSFLTVLKRFGPGNPGPLSFPMAGWTLAVDLPTSFARGGLLDELDEHVLSAGGRQYLTKDSRMRPDQLEGMYPRLAEFRRIRAAVDPSGIIQSDLSRRLGL